MPHTHAAEQVAAAGLKPKTIAKSSFRTATSMWPVPITVSDRPESRTPHLLPLQEE
jgi:hypothetical protein